MGEIDERLESGRRRIKPIAQLRKCLQRAGIVACLQPVLEASDSDAAAGLDLVPRMSDAGAEGETAPLRAGVKAEVIIVTRSR